MNANAPRSTAAPVFTDSDRDAYRALARRSGLALAAFNRLVIGDLADRCRAHNDHNRAFYIETSTEARSVIPARDWLISAERVCGAEQARIADLASTIDNTRGE